jgi:hypothetical protein
MRENVLSKVRIKERRLLKLYSRWHETHSGQDEKRYQSLLGEILSVDPGFNPRCQFQIAF